MRFQEGGRGGGGASRGGFAQEVGQDSLEELSLQTAHLWGEIQFIGAPLQKSLWASLEYAPGKAFIAQK